MIRAALLSLAVSAACQSPPGGAGGGPGGDGGLPVSGDLALVRVARWPAGGVELTLRIDDGGARRDLSGAIHLAGGAPAVDWTARPVALAPGYTALLVRPAADDAARAAAEEAVTALLAARPPEEQLALFRWGAAVDQVVGFTRDRGRLERGLASALTAAAGEEPLAPADAALAAATEVADIGGSGPRVMRAVIAIGEQASEVAETARALTPVPVLAVGDSAALAAEAVDRLALDSHYTVAVCGAAAADSASLSVDGVAGELAVTWPTPWPESLGGSCDAGAIGLQEQAVPEKFELLFSAEQRAIYDDRVASLSKEEFELSVRLAADQQPIAARAHLHGKGTLGCPRKSYTLTLEGPGRHLFADSYDDEVFLIAMCADDRYLQLHTSDILLSELGLFPLRFRYVEVTLDGEERGVYLLTQKSDDTLERDNSRVSAVLRRRFDVPGDHMEVEKSRGDPEAASGAWDTFQQSLTALSGQDLLDAARARIDVDGYLTWVALMTVLENGDYVDEVLATATDARSPGGDIPEYWTFTAWDNDDLFSTCHHHSDWAMVDPNELLYCVEGEIDYILLADPFVYAHYTDLMRDLLARITPEHMQEAIDRTGAALLPWFERPEICQAMEELLMANPAAADPVEAQRDIREHLDLLRDQYVSRRAVLESRLDGL